MTNAHLWQRAAAFAARAHRGQTRQDKETPYFAHPARVALTIAAVFGFDDPEILAGALLHDVIEDTDADYDDVHERFGPKVATYVAAMTKDMRLPEAKREPAYDNQLAHAPWQARLIKLADVYDNLHDRSQNKPLSKIIEKAKRILELTESDARLQGARKSLREAIGRVKRSEGPKRRRV